MSLREDIAIMYVRKRKNQVGTELADEIINKVLDAAVESFYKDRVISERNRDHAVSVLDQLRQK